MDLVNIRSDVRDAYYRYKMPKLKSKIEGRGNGIKTVIPNMEDLGKALARPPAYITKYFGCELGAQSICDDKKSRYVVNGEHSSSRLFELLNSFIEKFVLCTACKNPETDLCISKGDETIKRKCKACGERSLVDMRQKLCAYIIKNPPPPPKKGKKNKEAKGSGDSNSPSDGSDNGDIIDAIDNLSPNVADDDNADDDDWAVDISPEAISARSKEAERLNSLMNSKLSLGDDTENDPYEEFANYIQANRQDDGLIFSKFQELGLRKDKAVAVLVQCMFDDDVKIVNDIGNRASLIKKFVSDDKSKRGVIGGFERLVGVVKPSLMGKSALVLKALYDNEIVDEESILQWGDSEKISKRYVDKKTGQEIRDKIKVFVEWLKTAEEESSDED